MLNNEKVYVKSFPGATIKCMEDLYQTINELQAGRGTNPYWNE